MMKKMKCLLELHRWEDKKNLKKRDRMMKRRSQNVMITTSGILSMTSLSL
jgi:GH24 family phage-related lysozyme (muramidase)